MLVCKTWTVKFVFHHVAHRYLGEEEDGSASKKSRSEALLAKLQQKAKEKQKQSLTEQRQHPPEEQTEQQDVKKKRKADKESSQKPQPHKKRKSEVEPSFASDSDCNDEPLKDKKKGKKSANEKKKKKDQSGMCWFLYTHADNIFTLYHRQAVHTGMTNWFLHMCWLIISNKV